MLEHKNFSYPLKAPEGSSEEAAEAVRALGTEAQAAEARLRRLLEQDAADKLLDAQSPADA